MRFTELGIPGAYLIDLDERRDERGFFARTFCAREFAEHGLVARVAQCNLSYNDRRGTLRGLHFQDRPAPEAKLVRCIHGAIHMVVVDRRADSPTYLQHVGVDLVAAERRALYVPELCANGYQTLTDGAEVAYQVSEFHTPETERGMRYDDPALGIDWPLPVEIISEKDRSWPLLSAQDTRR